MKKVEAQHEHLALVFRALGDTHRLKILAFLEGHDEITVRDLAQLLEQSQPALSHHLTLLRKAGLIEYRRSGRNNFYRLSDTGLLKIQEQPLRKGQAVHFHYAGIAVQLRWVPLDRDAD
jgi:DNA-binding transcriptional ArsR family regulator